MHSVLIRVPQIWIGMALMSLVTSLFFGLIANLFYLYPEKLSSVISMERIRPIHVSFGIHWILMASKGIIYRALFRFDSNLTISVFPGIHLAIWITGWVMMAISYFQGIFGGREYSEYPPMVGLVFAISWFFFLIAIIRATKSIPTFPTYLWMWLTGAFFYLLILGESYLWLLPKVFETGILDLLIQWKSTGSLVGAQNMLVYGIAVITMNSYQPSPSKKQERLQSGFFLLSFANMLFNWGHHLYLVPVGWEIHHLGYIVSMTEWIFFILLIREWSCTIRKGMGQKHIVHRWILAYKFWLVSNLFLALLISIPAVNLFAHGTHIVSAHAMGSMIGILSSILVAGLLAFFCNVSALQKNRQFRIVFWGIHLSLGLFLISLVSMGVHRSRWLFSEPAIPFSVMMQGSRVFYWMLLFSGMILMASFLLLIYLFYRFRDSTVPHNSSLG